MANTRLIRTLESSRSLGASVTIALGIVSVGMRALTLAGRAVDDALEVDGFAFGDD